MKFLLRRYPFLAKHADQGWRFIVSGSLGSVVDFGTLALFVEVMGIAEHLAVVYSTILAVIFVFFANKYFTFRNREKKFVAQATKFSIVYGIALILNIVVSWLLLWFGVHYFLAKACAIATTAGWNYLLMNSFVFKR